MRPFSFRLRLSALAWIAIGSTLGLSSGCQQWSLRKNMVAIFGEEPKDDWEPPIHSTRGDEDQQASDRSDTKRPWWSRRKGSEVQRVVLPRDRMAAASKYASESTNSLPKLPSAQLSDQSSVTSAKRTAVSPPSPPQNKSMDENKNAKPKGELVAFGANPAGWPGEVTSPPLDGASKAPSQDRLIDTGVQDSDLEASLQSLPPQFREVVQRTLQAVRDGKPIEKTDSMVAAEPTPTPPSSASDSLPAPNATAVAASTPTKPVSVRLSEGSVNSFAPSQSAIANPAPSNTSFVTPAASIPNPTIATGVTTASQEAQPSSVVLAVADVKNADQIVTTSAMPPAKSPSTSEVSVKSSTWHGVISEAIEKLESDLESKPTADESLRRSQEITLRMLYVAQRRLDDALRPIERLEAHEQEYVRHQMQALYEASNPDANPAKARHWSSVMMSQREATAHLAAVSNLEVRSVAFCTQVDGYGVFTRFAKNQFTPDQDVLLYCEIDNVAAEKVKLGYETQLQGSYEIRDGQGRLVADQDLPMETEICTSHRRAYFIVYRIYKPSQLAPGNYELRLTIHDKKGGKYGHSSAPFEIRK